MIAELQAKIAAAKQRNDDPARRSQALIDLGIREAQCRGWNDTYTFTKWLGEQIACREMAHGTLAIVRPAIVESACREPQPGWIEGMKVGDAIVLAYARGKTRLFPARTAGVADIIRVDLVANSIILATAHGLAKAANRVARCFGATRNLAVFERLETTRQLAVVFSFYTSPRCVFDNRQLLALAAAFDESERQRFEVDPRCFDWPNYVARIHLPGLERYALKDAPAGRSALNA